MKLRYIIAPALIFSMTGISSVSAQNNDSEERVVFEEILVTATKREQNIYEVPVAVTAFTADTIERAGIVDINDVGKFVPNLTITNFSAGQTSSANPFIRGIGLQDHLITTDPGVGIYVDGVYLGRQVGQNWNLADAERVEVLRGPQGTLYGRNSIGGAINIITRKPGEETSSRISLQAGSRGRINGQYFGSYRLSDTVGVSLSAGYNKRNGLGNFTSLNTSTEVGETEDLAGRLSLAWTPNEKFSLLLTADANDADNGLNPYTTLIDEIPNGAVAQSGLSNADVAADRFDNATGQADLVDVSNSASGFSATADYALSDTMSLKFVASTRTSDYTAGLDDDSTATNFLAFGETGEADQSSYELQLNATYDRFDFVTGIYYFEEDGFNDQPSFTFNAGGGSETLSQEVTSFAVYGNVGFDVTDNLRLSGGLRYTEDEKNAGVNLIFGLIDTVATAKFDEVSWDLSASYALNNGMSVYGSVASGFQSGQFNPRPFCLFGSLDFSQPGNVTRPNCFDQNLENITAINYEAGIKGQLTNNFKMSLAVFNTEFQDLPYQVSNSTAEGFNTVNIIVDQTSRGVEWESSWSPSSGFFINTSFGYIDIDVDDPNPFVVAPLTPEFTASISPEYTFPWASTGGSVTMRADYSYRDDLFGEPSSDPGRLTQVDSRAILNFDVSYLSPDEQWSLGLYGRNVTDERYESGRLNTGDYVIVILANDASEFGVRFTRRF
ncbi:MAG: iron complex outermembrane receptor protein [Polaribacter sp.]|jgi:iron complex outermembrane receptor protein